MYKLLNNKFILTLMVIIGFLQLFAVSYLGYVLNQQYILHQFQIIIANEETVPREAGVYTVDGTDFEVGIDCGCELENGIVFYDDSFDIYINENKVSETYAEFDIETLDDLYNNYLVYRYSYYMTPYVIIFFLINSLLSYVLILALLYLSIKVHEHSQFRKGIYQYGKFYSFKDKMKINFVAAFGGILFYSYLSFAFNNVVLLILMSILVAILIQQWEIKTFKKRR